MTRTRTRAKSRPKTRTHLSIDNALLEHAMRFFKTESKSDAVNEALAFVARSIAFEEEVAFAKAGGYDDLIHPPEDPA